jgi:hypothetical protein
LLAAVTTRGANFVHREVCAGEQPATPATAPLSQRIDRAVADFYRGPEIPRANEWDLHRRVSLDLIGRGPTIEEQDRHQQRLQQPGVDRDAAWRSLVDELLARDEFTRQWARVLEVQFSERRPDEKISTLQFRAWLRNALAQNRPRPMERAKRSVQPPVSSSTGSRNRISWCAMSAGSSSAAMCSAPSATTIPS